MKLSRKKAKVVTSAIEAWIEDNIHKAIFFASLAVSFWLTGGKNMAPGSITQTGHIC